GLPSGDPPSPADYRAGADARASLLTQLRTLFGRFDVLASPTTLVLAPTIDSLAGAFQRSTGLTLMFNWIRWPALSVPCGVVDKLPVGIQLAAPPRSEALLLRAGRALQAAMPPRLPPLL